MGGYTKWIITIETIALIVLLLMFFHAPKTPGSPVHEVNRTGLLSPRVYERILEPQSYLIINYAPLRKDLLSYIGGQNGTISVYLVNLRDGASMSIDSQREFFPASMNKVPIAVIMMKKVENGELTLNTMIPIHDSDRVDHSSSLFQSPQKEFPLHVLIEKMLQESDNIAFKALLHYIQEEDYVLLGNYLGFFSDDGGKLPTDSSLITARSVYNVFSSLYLSTVLEPQDSEYILGLLTTTVFDLGKIAQLPNDFRLAQKFATGGQGNITVFHSCGIMYHQEMKIFFCIMTEGFAEKDAVTHVATITNRIYQYSVETRKELDKLKEAGK